MVEYALVVALFTVAVIGAVQYTVDEGGDELAGRGARVGAPDVDAARAAPPPIPVEAPSPPEPDLGLPAPVAAGIADLAGCWAPTGNSWTARYVLDVEDELTGAPVSEAVVRVELRIVQAGGEVRVETVDNALSGPDGRVVITRQALSASGPQAGRDVRVELSVTSVTGSNLTYAAPTPPPTAVVDQGGARC